MALIVGVYVAISGTYFNDLCQLLLAYCIVQIANTLLVDLADRCWHQCSQYQLQYAHHGVGQVYLCSRKSG